MLPACDGVDAEIPILKMQQKCRKMRWRDDLDKDAFGVGAGHAVHAIKGKLEVRAAQQR